MKLQETKLCVNCETLYEGPGPCPSCASKTFIWLYPVLGTVLEPDAYGLRQGLKGDLKHLRSKVVPALN